jgi:hypothetical protein
MKGIHMWKTACVVCAVLALALCLGTAQTQTQSVGRKVATGPEIGFDYRAFITEHQALINSGQVEKAVEYIKSNAKYPKAFDPLEEPFRKTFASIYGSAGKQENFEFIGYKRYSSRQYQFYAMAYYENGSIQWNYGFELHGEQWKWIQLGSQANPDEMGKVIPLQLMGDGRIANLVMPD